MMFTEKKKKHSFNKIKDSNKSKSASKTKIKYSSQFSKKRKGNEVLTRVVNYEKTMKNLSRNSTIEAHATADLRKGDPDIYFEKSIQLGNFTFLLRAIIYHLLLVGLANNPVV